jgi:hypothetical protein
MGGRLMPKVFILARDYSEASWIARLAGFKGSIGWDVMGDFNTMGCRGNVVLSTAMHCWRAERGFDYAEIIGELLVTRDLKLVHVPCPQEWKATGFQLPEGWDAPKEYPPRVFLHAPEPRLTWARRLRQVFSR